MCAVFSVSPSGYYAHGKRAALRQAKGPSCDETKIRDAIKKIFWRHRKRYGSPRIYQELKARGFEIGRHKIARIMKSLNLCGISRRKAYKPAGKSETPAVVNELQRDFTARGPNETWVADITYIHTVRGFIYLAVVLDVFSRRIVGYSICSHLRTDGVLQALHMAISSRKPAWGELRHHTDRGCQYTSKEFRTHCRNAGIVRSMSAPGTPHDNAMCESFFATLKSELIYEQKFMHLEQATPIIEDYISNYYNKDRRHSALGFLSPSQFEQSMASKINLN